jgi:hypothetical protein
MPMAPPYAMEVVARPRGAVIAEEAALAGVVW